MRKFILLFACVLLISCQDEIDILKDNEIPEVNYLKLSSVEELSKTLEDLVNLSNSELRAFEEMNDYISFNSKCNDVYDFIRNTEFETLDEMYHVFDSYNKYVEIIDDEGMMEACTKVSNSPLKYIINEDQIIQIGDSLYKVLSNYIVKAKIEEYKFLKCLNEKDIPNISDNPKFDVYKSNSLSLKKDVTYNAGYDHVKRSTELNNNNRRVKMRIHIYQVWPLGVSDIWCDHRIAAQRQILGVWFNYNAEIDAQIKIRYDYRDNWGVWHTLFEDLFYDGVEEDVIENHVHICLHNSMVSDSWFHFGGYDCYATTDDITNSAILTANTSILP